MKVSLFHIRQLLLLPAAIFLLFPGGASFAFIQAFPPAIYEESGIRVSYPSEMRTGEEGTTAEFQIVMTRRPGADIFIPIRSSDPSEGVVSPEQVRFTPRDWNRPVTVTVTGVADDVRDGDIEYQVLLGPVVSLGQFYRGLRLQSLAVTNLDASSLDVNAGLPNMVPLAMDDQSITLANMPVVLPVLANDLGLNDRPLTVTITLTPAHGGSSLLPDNTVHYVPQPDFTGVDGFSYQVCDIDGDCSDAQATVTISQAAVPTAQPVEVLIANSDSFEMGQGNILAISAPGLLANDLISTTEQANIIPLQGPLHGSMDLNWDGSFTYTPAAEFVGEDAFTYVLQSGPLESNPATVTILVRDTTSPTLEWVTPAPAGTVLEVEGQEVQLEAMPGDNDEVKKVRFYRWDTLQQTYLEIGEVYTAPYQIQADTSLLNPEWNQVFARAYDQAGNGSDREFIWLFLLSPTAEATITSTPIGTVQSAQSPPVLSRDLFLPMISR